MTLYNSVFGRLLDSFITLFEKEFNLRVVLASGYVLISFEEEFLVTFRKYNNYLQDQ